MKRLLLSILAAATLLTTGGLAVAPAYAAPIDNARNKVCEGVSGTGTNCNSGGVDLGRVVRAALNVLSVIAGVAAVIMIIISGMKYITSSGDAQAVTSAKRTLIYAIVGLVVVALSQVLVKYVLRSAQ